MIRISVFRDSRLLVIHSDWAQKKNKGGDAKLFSERFTVRRTAAKVECPLFFLCILCVVFVSCGMSPEKMLTEYNDLFIYETSEEDTEHATDQIMTLSSLLPYDEYSVIELMSLRLSVSEKYVSYSWKLTGSDGKEYTLVPGTMDFQYINTNGLQLAPGKYTVEVQVTNIIGNRYRDTAAITVTES